MARIFVREGHSKPWLVNLDSGFFAFRDLLGQGQSISLSAVFALCVCFSLRPGNLATLLVLEIRPSHLDMTVYPNPPFLPYKHTVRIAHQLSVSDILQ